MLYLSLECCNCGNKFEVGWNTNEYIHFDEYNNITKKEKKLKCPECHHSDELLILEQNDDENMYYHKV